MRQEKLVKARDILDWRREDGFSLITVVIIAGVILAGVGFSLKRMDDRMKSLKMVRMYNRLTMLEDRVKNSASARQALYVSATKAPTSSDLYRCMIGGSCRHTEGFSQTYQLYNSTGDKVSGYFDLYGKPCKGPSKKCLIEVSVKYEISCPEGAASPCPQADEIATSYVIHQNDTQAFRGRMFKDRVGSASFSIFSCPSGQYVTGVDAKGRLLCDTPVASLYASTCEPGEVAFGLTGDGQLKCMKVTNFCAEPLTLISVLDTSGSMNGQNKIGGAKSSAKTLISQLKTKDEGGLVTFNSKATSELAPSNNWNNLNNRIDGLKANGMTNMTDGLEKAMDYIKAGNGKNPKGIIFLSDGWHNTGPAPAVVAETIKKAGIHIWTIGFGSNADARMLQSIASSPSNYFYASDNNALQKAFDSISGIICRKP